MTMFRAPRRLYVTEDRKHLAEEGSEKAAYLLAPEGGDIPEPIARKYGLIKDMPKPADKAVAKVATK